MGTKIDLNGWWDWRVPGGAAEKKWVPSCYICVGEAIYSRTFELPDMTGKRAVLHFEGVHYTGAAKVNGAAVGEMLPFIFYDFDITEQARQGENTVEVLICDITAKHGPTNFWEDYGGISRDVWIVVTDEVFISDAHWMARMRNDYASADADLNVWIGNKTGREADAAITATLAFNGSTVAKAEAKIALACGTSKCQLGFALDNVNAWSPAHPDLYSLAIEIASGGMADKLEMEAGFREFAVKGESFYLNGVKTFLKGVTRHELWGDHQGFTLTKGQIEDDLSLIKEMGANFIRLVHYPHSRHTIEYAAKIGLMVSEEPGLCGKKLSDGEAIGNALAIMEKTVLRDRSSPAVVAWLYFNECTLDDTCTYLKRGIEMCRSLDPGRLLSCAHFGVADNSVAKQLSDEAGLDFYTVHPYCYEAELVTKGASEFRGKPLVLTEWGGWFIHYNPNLIKLSKRAFAKLAHNPDGMPHINGMCWWQWQDIWQFSRGLPGCEDGLLSDGLVTVDRKRKPTYAVMAEYFDLVDRKPEPLFDIEEYPGIGAAVGKELIPVDLSEHYGLVNDGLWEEAVKAKKRYPNTPQFRQDFVDMSGIMIHREIKSLSGLRCEIPAGRPLILRDDRPRIEAKVGFTVGELFLFGAVTYFDGYPVRGVFGETAAIITLQYADGSSSQKPLRHGIETASASMIARCSRLDARAASAPRVAKITLDRDFEVFAVNMLRIAADEGRILESVIIESADQSFDPVVYGISVI